MSTQLKQVITISRNKLIILRISLGVIFLFFGILKFVPHISPAEVLAEETINKILNGLISKHTGFILLAIFETSLGIMFILGKFLKIAISIALMHMLFTFLPLFLTLDPIYADQLFVFTLTGQYIMKNIVFISALWLLWPINEFSDETAKLNKSQTSKSLSNKIEA